MMAAISLPKLDGAKPLAIIFLNGSTTIDNSEQTPEETVGIILAKLRARTL